MLFSGTEYGKAPADDEIEVSILGLGYGEAITIHVGDGRWIAIDSCIFPKDKKPATLRYFEDIGVGPDQVIAIIASHWDDDHIRGMSKMVENMPGAQFVTSRAFGTQEFLAYATAFDSPFTEKVSSGVKEMRNSIKAMETGTRRPRDSGASRCLIHGSEHEYSHSAPVELWTLSPSEKEYENFLMWVHDQMPTEMETRRVAESRIRNDLSTVALLKVGERAVLLGGDLEEEGDSKTGWSAILASEGRPDFLADIFKIPHHGSINGDNEETWKRLLAKEPIAVLTPWRLGRGRLPEPSDVERILGRTKYAYSSAKPGSAKAKRRDHVVEKLISGATKSFSSNKSQPGLVRLRFKMSADQIWRTEMFGGATHLSRLYA